MTLRNNRLSSHFPQSELLPFEENFEICDKHPPTYHTGGGWF